MYKLRGYQQEASDSGVEFFNNVKDKRSAVIVIPTGGGKSLVIADIAMRLNGNVLVFQPSKELLEQNHSKYESYGNTASIYSASKGIKEIGKVTFATIGSVYKKPDLFKHFDYCIVDECHLVSPNSASMYSKFFEGVNVKLLGLTATPVRMKQYNFPEKHSKLCMLDRTRPRVFNGYIHVTQVGDLVSMGFFSKTEYSSHPFNSSMLKINSTGGDYTDDSMNIALKENNVIGKIKESISILRGSGRKNILIFVPTVREAAILAKEAGGAYVCGDTKKKEREDILSDFKNGKLPFVSNVGVLTTGFDFPELDTIILGRPTMSLALYYQMIGRGVRPHADKEKCVIIDYVGNIEKFGEVEKLVIKDGEDGWGVFAGDRLLTNRDIAKLDDVYAPKKKTPKDKMAFGKHKGEKFDDVPVKYMRWVYENVEKKSYTRPVLKWIEENKHKIYDKQLNLF